ncbi:MAG: PKD domain-containing protein [Halorientalis sp.]
MTIGRVVGRIAFVTVLFSLVTAPVVGSLGVAGTAPAAADDDYFEGGGGSGGNSTAGGNETGTTGCVDVPDGVAPSGGTEPCDTNPPTAEFTASATTVTVGEPIGFDATGSTDNGTVESYEWTFNDSESATGVEVSHAYDEPGSYVVELIVTDDQGYEDAARTTIEVVDGDGPGDGQPGTNGTDGSGGAGDGDTGNGTDGTNGTDDAVSYNVTRYSFSVGPVGLFGASGEIDGAPPQSYEWTFHDGTTKTGPEVRYTYDDPGTYDYELTLTGVDGTTKSFAGTITIRSSNATAFCRRFERARENGTTDDGSVLPLDRVAAVCDDLNVTSPGKRLVVDDDGPDDVYHAIGPAVANASDGDRIVVKAGNYDGGVTVGKNVTIVGEGGPTVTDASGTATAFRIPAGGHAAPTIRGFTFEGVTALDATGTEGDWTLAEATISNVDDHPVRARDADGDWTITDARLENTGGIGATGANGSWTISDTTIRSGSSDAIDAAGTDGGWTIRNVTVRDHADGIDVRETAGFGRILNVTVTDTGGAGITASRSTGRLRIVDATVSGNAGPGIVLRDVTDDGDGSVPPQLGGTQAPADWVVRDARVSDNGGRGIAAARLGGSARFENVTLTGNGNDGLSLAEASGSWVVVDATVRHNDAAGIDAAETTGTWSVRASNVSGNALGVLATGATRDWIVSGSTIRANADEGIEATGTTGDWRVQDTVVSENGAGIVAARSAGDWTVDNATVEFNDGVGIDAGDSTGNWTVQGTTDLTDNGIVATGTSGRWAVHRTNLLTAEIDATGANPRGNARRNWWGTQQGAGPVDACVGNVTCRNPLGERASEDAIGISVAVNDGSSDRPFPGADVYLYEREVFRTDGDRVTTADLLSAYDGTEYYADPSGRLRAVFGPVQFEQRPTSKLPGGPEGHYYETGPEGLVRLTGLTAGTYCLLVAPPDASPRNVRTGCVEVSGSAVEPVAFTHTNGTSLDHLTDEFGAIRDRSDYHISDVISLAAGAYIDTGRALKGKELVTQKNTLASIRQGMQAAVEASVKRGVNPKAAAKEAVTTFATQLARSALVRASRNRIKRLYGEWAFSAVERGDASRFSRYASLLGRTEWMEDFRYVGPRSGQLVSQYETLPPVATARRAVANSYDRITAVRDGTGVTRDRPPASFDPAAVESVVQTQKRAIAGEWLAEGIVVTPTGAVYAINKTAGARQAHREAYEKFRGSKGAKKLSSFVGKVGSVINTGSAAHGNVLGMVVGSGVEAIGAGGEVLFGVTTELARYETVKRNVRTQLYALHDIENVGMINRDIANWLETEYRDPSVGNVSGEIVESPTFPENGFGVNVVEANRPRDPGPTATRSRYVADGTIAVENTGTATVPSRVVVVSSYHSDQGDGTRGLYGEATTVPAPKHDAMEIPAGGTVRKTATVTLGEPESDPFRIHFVHTMLVMEGKQVDHETAWTFLNISTTDCNYIEERQNPAECANDPDGRYGYDYTERDGDDPPPRPRRAAGAMVGAYGAGTAGYGAQVERMRTDDAVYTTAGSAPGKAMTRRAFSLQRANVETLVDAELDPQGSTTTRLTTANNTDSVTLMLVGSPNAETSLSVTDGEGRTTRQSTTTGRTTAAIPDSEYRTGGVVDRVRIENASDLDLSVTVRANAPDREEPVPVEVVAVETPERPPIMGVIPSTVDVTVTPGRDRTAALELAEVGGQQAIADPTVTVGNLTTAAGARLPADAVTLGDTERVPAGETVRATLTVSLPADFDVSDDAPTRFTGTVTVGSDDAGSVRTGLSVLTLDSPVANATLLAADRTVTGVHLDRAGAATAAVDGTPVAGYDAHVLGTGTATVRLPATAGNLTAYAVGDRNATALDTTSTGGNVTVTLPAGDYRVVVAAPDTGAGDTGGTDGDTDGSDGDTGDGGTVDGVGEVGIDVDGPSVVTTTDDGAEGDDGATTRTTTKPPTEPGTTETTAPTAPSTETATAPTGGADDPAADIADTTAETTTADGAGFGLVATLVALVALLAVAARRP